MFCQCIRTEVDSLHNVLSLQFTFICRDCEKLMLLEILFFSPVKDVHFKVKLSLSVLSTLWAILHKTLVSDWKVWLQNQGDLQQQVMHASADVGYNMKMPRVLSLLSFHSYRSRMVMIIPLQLCHCFIVLYMSVLKSYIKFMFGKKFCHILPNVLPSGSETTNDICICEITKSSIYTFLPVHSHFLALWGSLYDSSLQCFISMQNKMFETMQQSVHNEFTNREKFKHKKQFSCFLHCCSVLCTTTLKPTHYTDATQNTDHRGTFWTLWKWRAVGARLAEMMLVWWYL